MSAARTSAETPGEYQHHLRHSLEKAPFQEEKTALATITAAYHQARYAPDAPEDEQGDAVQATWDVLDKRLVPEVVEGETRNRMIATSKRRSIRQEL